MIKLEHVVLASPEQMEFIIEGMRNPMNSWDKSDSYIIYDCSGYCDSCDYDACKNDFNNIDGFVLGVNDYNLMKSLGKAGTDHRKFMRMMPAYVRITAPLYWWKEFDTYKAGTVANSYSTMRKVTEEEFTLEDFSTEHLYDDEYESLKEIIEILNGDRKLYLESLKKNDWGQIIRLLPSSYNQTRNVMMNYEVLANIYKSRKNHELDEWVEFCKWIETLPYSELITDKEEEYSSNPISKAYSILVDARNNNDMEKLDIDEVIGYLGEALE